MGVLDLRIFHPEEEYFYENIYKTQKSLLELFVNKLYQISRIAANIIIKP